jgi:hypothetical protein
MKACALYALARTGAPHTETIAALASQSLRSVSPVVRETAVWALGCLASEDAGAPAGRVLLAELRDDPDPAVARVARRIGAAGRPGLITVQKVAALKVAGIFAATPDEVLVQVAGPLVEVDLPAGEDVICKGEPGDAMYLVVEGELCTHDGELVLNTLRPGEGFGEMAVLDARPRSATVTTTAPARLLRLAGHDLHRLIDERPEVARGIIRVLSRYLRLRLEDLAQAKN